MSDSRSPVPDSEGAALSVEHAQQVLAPALGDKPSLGLWDFVRELRLVLLIGALMVGIIAIGTIKLNDAARHDAHATAYRDAESLTAIVAEQVQRTLANVDERLRFVAHEIRRADGAVSLRRLVDDGAVSLDQVILLSLVDAQGRLVQTNEGPIADGPDLSARGHIATHLRTRTSGPLIGEPVVGRVSGKWSIHVSRPVRRADGSLLGIVVAAVDPAYFAESWRGLKLDAGGHIEMIGADGVLRARSHALEAALAAGVTAPDLVEAARGADSGRLRRALADGQSLSHFRRLDGVPLIVSVGFNVGAIERWVDAQQTRIIAGALTLAILLAIILVLLGHRTLAIHAERMRATATTRLLLEAIDALPVSFGLYDRDERLVLYNRRSAQLNGAVVGPQALGRTFAELLDGFIEQERPRHPNTDWAATRQMQLDGFHAGEPFDSPAADGTWQRNFGVAMADGGRVRMQLDITPLKRRENELQSSRRRYESLVNSLADVVFSCDRAGAISYISARVTRFLGYAADSLNGRDILSLFHEQDHDKVSRAMRSVHPRGAPLTVVCRAVRPDGAARYVEIRLGAGESDEAGNRAISGVIRDIHKQHHLVLQLRNEMSRLNSIVHSSGALILLVDRDGRVTMANSGFLALTGRSHEDVVGQPLDVVIPCPPDVRLVETFAVADGAHAPAPVEFDVALIDTRHEKRIIRVTAQADYAEDGRMRHLVLLGVDETARRAAEVRLFDASRLATLGEMASSIAHEINQPLAVIRLAAETLGEEFQLAEPDQMPAEFREFAERKLERIANQTERASTIIRDLRIFARKPDDQPTPFSVPDALRGAADLVHEQLRLASVATELQLEESCGQVMGHANRLQQVVINLMLNARDAMLEKPGDVAPAIRVRAYPKADRSSVVVDVEDNGPGIPAHVLPRLFEPFFTTKPGGKGTGLGLSISYEIVRQMGGTISAENLEGRGARFRFVLPTAPEATLVAAPAIAAE
ncbi:MAG: PAS domain S-box protein [Alphaproteobacteria bacterium]|nr:PAS domain S-box protein [Alphaproteobacteria bacterium]MCW5741143.1 PAS domain S-box protein [Alphaproteobacteria bacterium]